jgi:phosphoinositide-3-kinase regulatory subunit 4
VSHVIVALLTDAASTPAVKRQLLFDTTQLALFLRRQNTNDMLLPLLITLLNDREPSLRAAFFESVGGVCAFVGRASLQAFVLPCVMQALYSLLFSSPLLSSIL